MSAPVLSMFGGLNRGAADSFGSTSSPRSGQYASLSRVAHTVVRRSAMWQTPGVARAGRTTRLAPALRADRIVAMAMAGTCGEGTRAESLDQRGRYADLARPEAAAFP